MLTKVSVIGICGNAVFMSADHFHTNGETLVADSYFEEVSGKGINQSAAARKMGAEVSFLAAIGDDANGEKCIKAAKENGINAHFKIKRGKITPIAFILTDKNGENRVSEYKSAELSREDVISFEDEIKSSDVLLIQQEVSCEADFEAVRLAKKHGTKVILNPAPIREIPDFIAENVFLITPNEHEKTAVDEKKFKNCIVTLGKDGCIINGKTKIDAIKVKAVNTTGAGDIFSGTLAACIAEGMRLEKACRYAVAASGISVKSRCVLGAIPPRCETQKLIETLNVNNKGDLT